MDEAQVEQTDFHAARPASGSGSSPASARGELDLFSVFALQRRHLRRTAFFALAGFLLLLVEALIIKPRFSSTAVILIPPEKPTAATLIQKASGLDLLGGGFEIYLDIMKSRTVATQLVARYQLKTYYKVKEEEQAEKILGVRTTMVAAKEGMLRVTVEDTDPRMAADLANGYIQALDNLNHTLAITAAGQSRAYYEQQMIAEKNALADAEVALKQTQQQNRVLVPDSQAIGDLTAVESTRAQLRARQVELGALLQQATPQNPAVLQLRAEIAGIEEQLKTMQSGADTLATGTSSTKAPEVALAYVRALREVKFHEALFEMLARQYEAAKEEEAKNISMVEILDVAIPAKHKSWPPRTLLCLLGLIGGAAIGFLYTILNDLWQRVLANPENRARLQALWHGN